MIRGLKLWYFLLILIVSHIVWGIFYTIMFLEIVNPDIKAVPYLLHRLSTLLIILSFNRKYCLISTTT